VRWVMVPDVILVTGSSTLTAGETALVTRLLGSTLGMGVRTQTATNVANNVTGVMPSQLIIISDTASASTLGTTLTNFGIPILSMNAATFGNLQLTGATSGSDFGTTTGQTRLDITKAGHPLAGGLTGTGVQVTNSA